LATLLTKVQAVNLIASTIGISKEDFLPLDNHFSRLIDIFLGGATGRRTQFENILSFLRSLALGFKILEDSEDLISEELRLRLVTLQSDADLVKAIQNLIRIEKNAMILSELMSGERDEDDVNTDYFPLDGSTWIGNLLVEDIVGDTSILIDEEDLLKDQGRTVFNHSLFIGVTNRMIRSYESLFKLAEEQEGIAEAALFEKHPVFKEIAKSIRSTLCSIPPSGTLAGIYSAVDRTRGVWKAPANVRINEIIGPSVDVTNELQSDLNIPSSGKAINALRSFSGRGTLVWGARTLDGNSNEWRYINVRRLFIFIEESLKKTLDAFVFEPNDATTWLKIRGLTVHFLTTLWRQGALFGGTRADAFSVKIGLNETMTQTDILEGRLIVELGLAAVRPAEFIVLRLTQQMQSN
jgi:hypothetical protein